MAGAGIEIHCVYVGAALRHGASWRPTTASTSGSGGPRWSGFAPSSRAMELEMPLRRHQASPTQLDAGLEAPRWRPMLEMVRHQGEDVVDIGGQHAGMALGDLETAATGARMADTESRAGRRHKPRFPQDGTATGGEDGADTKGEGRFVAWSLH